jgi:hypothetical protein
MSNVIKSARNHKTALNEDWEHGLRDCIAEDITHVKIEDFATYVDGKYEDAFKDCISFSAYNGSLMPDSLYVEIYNKFKIEFPFLHLVMYSVVETKYFSEREVTIVAPKLLQKQRMILYLFYGLIRSK